MNRLIGGESPACFCLILTSKFCNMYTHKKPLCGVKFC